jgi:RNA polymerase sigma-70 factor (ECF subfamily)
MRALEGPAVPIPRSCVHGGAPAPVADRRETDSDDELMQRMAKGEHDALAELYRRHGAAVYSLARHICNDARAAEEVTQDTFLRAWRSAAGFESRGRCAAWLLQIARRRAIDERRRQGRQVETAAWQEDALAADAAADPEAAVVAHDLRARVRRALAAMSAEQRAVVEAVFFAGLTGRQASILLGIPPGTVKSRLRLAYAHLRAALGEPTPR